MDIGTAIATRMADQNHKIILARRFPDKAPKGWLGLKRLNVESAPRRSLVGAKGMRP